MIPEDTRLIVIDPGHGGKDQGAQSKIYPKCLEKNMALSTAKMVESFLRSYGYKTVMTRTDDSYLTLKERAKFANDKIAKLFVSVHFNAAENRKAHGIEVYYFNSEPEKKKTESSKKLAALVLDNVIVTTKGKSRGIKHGNFAVIRETKMPGIIVEGGFITNDDEVEKIKDAAYMKKIALGIAQGIRKYLQAEGDCPRRDSNARPVA